MKSILNAVLGAILTVFSAYGQDVIRMTDGKNYDDITNDTQVEVTVVDINNNETIPNVTVCGIFVRTGNKTRPKDCSFSWGVTDENGKVVLQGISSYAPGVTIYVIDDNYHDNGFVGCQAGLNSTTNIYKKDSQGYSVGAPIEKLLNISEPWRGEITIQTRKKRHPVAMADRTNCNLLPITHLNVAMPFDIYALDFLPPYGKDGKIDDFTLTVMQESVTNNSDLIKYNYRYDFPAGDGFIPREPIESGIITSRNKFVDYEAPLDGYITTLEDSFVYNTKTKTIETPSLRENIPLYMIQATFRTRSKYDEKGNRIRAWYSLGMLPVLNMINGQLGIQQRNFLINPLNNSLEFRTVNFGNAHAYEYEWNNKDKVRYFRDASKLTWISMMLDSYSHFSLKRSAEIEPERKAAWQKVKEYPYPTIPEYEELKMYK